MKKIILFVLIVFLVILLFIFITKDETSETPIKTHEQEWYLATNGDFIETISISEGISYEAAIEKFENDREYLYNCDIAGSFSYIMVEDTTSVTYTDAEYSATLFGCYEIYSSEDGNKITDCFFYSTGESFDGDWLWVQSAANEGTDEYPRLISEVSVTGYFENQTSEGQASEPITLTQTVDVNPE